MRRQMNWGGICHFKAGDDKIIALRMGFESGVEVCREVV